MSSATLPILTGQRVTLRRPRGEDFKARVTLGTDAEIVRMCGGSRSEVRPMTEEEARRWVQQLLDHDYAWVIESDTLIGHIRLDRLDLRDMRASLAIGIDAKAQLGIGLGTEAIGLVLDYAFRTPCSCIRRIASSARASATSTFGPECRIGPTALDRFCL